MGVRFTGTPHPLKVSCVGQSELALHSSGLVLPVCFLDVVVHLRRQAMAALFAPAFEHFAASASFHPGAKTVGANAMSFLRLISSLRHNTPFEVSFLTNSFLLTDA